MEHTKDEWKTIRCHDGFCVFTGFAYIAGPFEFDEVPNNIVKCRNEHDRLQAKADLFDELVDVVKGLVKEADDGSALFDDPAPDSIFIKAEKILDKVKELTACAE